MKLFKAIAATSAVITCCIGNPLPAKASIFIDINSNREVQINDGENMVVVKTGGASRFDFTSSARRPVPSKNEQFFRSLPSFEGTSGVKLRKNNVESGSSEVIQAGVNSEGNFYIIKDLGGVDNARDWLETFYNMTEFETMPRWTIGSITQ